MNLQLKSAQERFSARTCHYYTASKAKSNKKPVIFLFLFFPSLFLLLFYFILLFICAWTTSSLSCTARVCINQPTPCPTMSIRVPSIDWSKRVCDTCLRVIVFCCCFLLPAWLLLFYFQYCKLYKFWTVCSNIYFCWCCCCIFLTAPGCCDGKQQPTKGTRARAKQCQIWFERENGRDVLA